MSSYYRQSYIPKYRAISIDKVHRDFKIDISNLTMYTVTDSGSNFIKAYKYYGIEDGDEQGDELQDEITVVDLDSIMCNEESNALTDESEEDGGTSEAYTMCCPFIKFNSND